MNESVLAAGAIHPGDEAAVEWIALQAETTPGCVRRVLEALADWRRNNARANAAAGRGAPAKPDWRHVLHFVGHDPTYGEIEARRKALAGHCQPGSGAAAEIHAAASAAIEWRNAHEAADQIQRDTGLSAVVR